MPVILESAEDYSVKDGDTLLKIAEAKCKELGWKVLAQFNWGTTLPREVRRALRETVGVKTSDLGKIGLAGSPENLELKPDADLAPKIRIPKAWKKDSLTLEKTTVVDVKRTRPANAVAIIELDKWFIPEKEKCAFEYGLEGEGDRADKVQLDVFGSNYCECTDWKEGLGVYSDPTKMVDEPVYTLDLATQNEERTDYELPGDDGWKGEVTTTKGILGNKTGTATKRFINVAFSPYTAHLRYWKADGDKKARIILDPFWPILEETPAKPTVTPTVEAGKVTLAWKNVKVFDYGVVEVTDAAGQRVFWAELPKEKLADGDQTFDWDKKYNAAARNGKMGQEYLDDSGPGNDGLLFLSAPYVYVVNMFRYKAKAESLKIKWEIKETTKLERGYLEITDNKGKIVFQKPLAKAKLSGKKDFQWDGNYDADIKNSLNGKEIIPADMPYRVQIQANSGVNVAEGLALAAMHTEVRLYTDPTTRTPLHLAFDPLKVKRSMNLEVGPRNIGDDPTEGSTKWYRLKLAEAGFHPGPVTDDSSADTDYHISLKEFKRSVPADGSVSAPNFTRLKIDTSEAAGVVTAIKKLRGSDKRAMWGDPAKVSSNNEAPDFSDDEVKEKLPDSTKNMIVWVDDRQYYTEDSTSKDDAGNAFTSGNDANTAFGLGNYRGAMDIGDGKVGLDTAAIPRPWVPLKATPRLLSREKELTDEVKPEDVAEEMQESMRKNIGPLRLDWTFDELPPDVPNVPGLTNYSADFIRSKYYVAWALWQNKDQFTRLDTKRKAIYSNCTATLGGSRPASSGSYYKEPFGLDKLNLAPWKAVDSSTTGSIATVIHEHLRKEQVAKTDLWEKQIGGAGVYFRPSRIAGDGYRVRAEVVFEKATDYEFPNLEALKNRYPAKPQVHSAGLRVWRRSSFRGYMCWGAATGNWGNAFINEFRAHYKVANVYFVHEGGSANEFPVTDVFSGGAGETKFKKIIKENVTADATLQNLTRMSLDPGYVWPWTSQDDFGWPWKSTVNITSAELESKFLDNIYNHTWRKYRAGLLMSLTKEVERKGYMRGHLMVEFEASPGFKMLCYKCDNPTPHSYWYMFKESRDNFDKDGEACPAPGCGPTYVLSAQLVSSRTALGLPAVGGALGATWLFWKGENIDRLKAVWVHEVGHHRHLEHSANAPGFKDNLHDSEANTKYGTWDAVKPPPGSYGEPSDDNVAGRRNAQKWDRRCIMSYSDCYYGELGCFCGRCLLRNRGWKVTGLGFPDSGKGDV
jgi:flagellar hook assembly protein FlgD